MAVDDSVVPSREQIFFSFFCAGGRGSVVVLLLGASLSRFCVFMGLALKQVLWLLLTEIEAAEGHQQ